MKHLEESPKNDSVCVFRKNSLWDQCKNTLRNGLEKFQKKTSGKNRKQTAGIFPNKFVVNCGKNSWGTVQIEKTSGKEFIKKYGILIEIPRVVAILEGKFGKVEGTSGRI